ncbi:hypothetical protein LMIY3S_00090 [Labrys miyagiensis]
MIELNTFSIVARCPRSGKLGVAVSTAVPAVGGICPFIEPGIGAIATQSWVNPYLGIDGLKLLREGLSAKETLDKLLAEDPGRDVRQLGIVDKEGRTAAFTGSKCVDWAGHIEGDGFTVQGNMLIGAATIDAMAEAAAKSAAFDLHERLMLVLEAGQAAGGDKRGKQSAAIKIFNKEAYAWLDVRVDEHRHPVQELRRVFEIAKQQLLPFIDGMPARNDPLGHIPEAITAMIMTPPPYRPGGNGGA